MIGKGAFGEVRLVQKLDTGRVYAMKTLQKAEMLKRDQVCTYALGGCSYNFDIYEICSSPMYVLSEMFWQSLHRLGSYSFITPSKTRHTSTSLWSFFVSVYIISPCNKCNLDKTAGGDLMTMLMKYDIFSEDVSRFYMAECILAIEAVHKLGYIHRCVPFNLFDNFRFVTG